MHVKKLENNIKTVWKYGKCDVLVVEGGDMCGLEDKLSTFSDSKCLVAISDIHNAEQQFVDTFCLKVVEELHNTLQVGQKLQELDPCYLYRIFQRRDLLNKEILKEKGITLSVSGATEACLATLIPPGEKVEKFISGNFDKNADCIFWLVESEAEFMALSRTVEVNVHWVEACEDGFRWKWSKGDMSSITKHCKEDPAIYGDINKIIKLRHHMVLIVAEPGMGKTTEISNIAHLIKSRDTCTWVVRFHLNEWTSLLGQQVPALEFLLQAATLNTEFEKHLLQYQLESVGNVVVILDGIDERRYLFNFWKTKSISSQNLHKFPSTDVNERDRELPLRLAEEIETWFVVEKLLEKRADETDLIWPARGEVHTTDKQVDSGSESDEYCMIESLQNVMLNVAIDVDSVIRAAGCAAGLGKHEVAAACGHVKKGARSLFRYAHLHEIYQNGYALFGYCLIDNITSETINVQSLEWGKTVNKIRVSWARIWLFNEYLRTVADLHLKKTIRSCISVMKETSALHSNSTHEVTTDLMDYASVPLPTEEGMAWTATTYNYIYTRAVVSPALKI
ncbi:hypothetical protein L9F63_018964, partial [Diploptera punctata]